MAFKFVVYCNIVIIGCLEIINVKSVKDRREAGLMH